MLEIQQILKSIVQKLETSNIPYMLSGSVAASFYEVPRFTNDIDIVIQARKSLKPKLIELFEHDYIVSDIAIDDAFSGVGMFNIIHKIIFIKCDFILMKSDEFSQSCLLRRQKKMIDDFSFFMLSIEDLILQKLLWRRESNSELQLKDVENLLQLNRESIDTVYLKHWGKKLSLSKDLEKLL